MQGRQIAVLFLAYQSPTRKASEGHLSCLRKNKFGGEERSHCSPSGIHRQPITPLSEFANVQAVGFRQSFLEGTSEEAKRIDRAVGCSEIAPFLFRVNSVGHTATYVRRRPSAVEYRNPDRGWNWQTYTERGLKRVKTALHVRKASRVTQLDKVRRHSQLPAPFQRSPLCRALSDIRTDGRAVGDKRETAADDWEI